jgi:hypothetical protein
MFLAVFHGLVACASQRPVLYPNERFEQVGSDVAEKTIDDCKRRAEEYVSSGGREGEVAGSAVASAGAGAAVGAAAGAAGGAVVGHAGRGAGVGAASGAAVQFAWGLLSALFGSQEPSPATKAFVERCLREKGYDPIGWK